MNDQDYAFKLQAYVDGELPEAEAREMADSLSCDIGGKHEALHQELQTMKRLLRGNEMQHAVPETREFYWSQIVRSIAVAPAGRRAHATSFGWLLRWLLPVGATAALCFYWLMPSQPGAALEGPLVGHEIETPLEETISFAFRSESAAMTVVWVETRGLHNLSSAD